MKILLLLLLGIMPFDNSISLKSTISSDGFYIFTNPYIIRNNQNGQYFLLSFFYDDNHGYFKVYDSNEQLVLSKMIKTRAMYRRLCFIDKNYFYFFSDKLFRLDIDKLKLDSVVLGRKNYNSVSELSFNNSKILAAKSDDGIDIYDLSGYKKFKFLRSSYTKPEQLQIFNNILIFRSIDNALTGYDIENNAIKWELNTGQSDAKLWGIKLGTYNNFITSYKVIKNNSEAFLYVTTAIGDLYKLDPLSGKVLIKRERFRGDDNNSGLITDLQYADMNGDGVDDLIGPSVDYNIYCLNGKDLSILWQFNTEYENQMPVTLLDINKDGIPEVFTVNDKMKLSVLDGKSGKSKLTFQIDKEKNQTMLMVGYFYGNKQLNIIAKANDKEIRIFELKTL